MPRDIISIQIPDGPAKTTQFLIQPINIAFVKTVLDMQLMPCYTDVTANGGATIRLYAPAAVEFLAKYGEWLSNVS